MKYLVHSFVLFVPASELFRLREKVFDQLAIMFFFDSGEEPRAEFSNRGGFIEKQAIVYLATAEVTWHAFGLEDWFELRVEIDSLGGACRYRPRNRGDCAGGFGPPARLHQQQSHRD